MKVIIYGRAHRNGAQLAIQGIRLITTEIPELNTIKGNSLIQKVS